MTRTYLPRFLRAGGKLLPDTRVARLEEALGQWRMVATHRGRGQIRVRAETVFVCGGAVQTPALLRRSGLGRNVGNSLCLHPTAKIIAEFEGEVNSREMGVPVHQVKEFAPGLSFGCSISSAPYLALGTLAQQPGRADVRSRWRNMAAYYVMVAGTSRGTVRNVPGFRDALVRYQLTAADREELSRGLSHLAALLFEAGAVKLFPTHASGCVLERPSGAGSRQARLDAAGAQLMTIHLAASCPMGESAASVVNSFGKVHGERKLYVGDASILGGPPAVNPQGTIMALARRNVLHFLAHER